MSAIDQALKTIFKNAYPDSSDEDINSQIDNLKKTGSSAVSQALSFIPGMNSAKDIVTNAGPLADEAAKNPIVQTAAKGLTGQSLNSVVPNPGNPVSDVAQGAVVGGLKEMFDPTQAKPVSPTPPVAAAPMTSEKPMDNKEPVALALPDDQTKPPQGTEKANPVESSLMPEPTQNDDSDKRNALLNAEKKKHALGILPVLAGGIGDAISNASAPFGGKGSSGTAEKVAGELEQGSKQRKEDFELKLKNDPMSDISKAYRQMVLQIAPTLADNPNFKNMSAQAIGEKLPLVDTMMKAQAGKDAKELGMKQLQANKDISIGLKNDQHQDKLEQEYKQQLMSVRGDRNISLLEQQRDSAAQAYNLIKDSEDGKGGYNLSEPQLIELYGQLYTAMTGRGLTAEAQKAMDQATGKQKLASIATFVGLSPSATTQAVGDRLKHMTTTLGTQVQGNIDKRMESRMLPPSQLDPKRVDAIQKAGRGYSFQDLVEQSNKRKAGQSAAPSQKSIGGKNYIQKDGQWFEVQ